jgi:hypothetical protein
MELKLLLKIPETFLRWVGVKICLFVFSMSEGEGVRVSMGGWVIAWLNGRRWLGAVWIRDEHYSCIPTHEHPLSFPSHIAALSISPPFLPHP